jgi:hypothetical protein
MLGNNTHVQQWINQFDFEDQRMARAFLNEFEFISTDEFVSEIESTLEQKIIHSNKVALLPVRALISKDECYFPQKVEDLNTYINFSDGDINSESLKECREHLARAVSVEKIDTFNPIFIHPTENPGSEAIIGNLITQLCRKHRQKVVVGNNDRSPSVNDLRVSKCDELILIDDVIGSGDRVADFIKSILMNKTLKSWVSLGYMKLTVVSFMRSNSSYERLEKSKFKFNVEHNRDYPTFNDLEDDLISVYRELITKYTNKKEQFSFSYGHIFGRALFEHSIPNNTPSLIWRNVRKWKNPGYGAARVGVWNAVFPNRAMPNLIKQSIKDLYKHKRSRKHKMLAVLSLCDEVKIDKKLSDLSTRLDSPVAEITELVAVLQQIGLLDTALDLTVEGNAELNYLGNNHNPIVFSKENYYSKQML